MNPRWKTVTAVLLLVAAGIGSLGVSRAGANTSSANPWLLAPAAPIGAVVAWPGPVGKIPPDWLLCDGRELDRTVSQNIALFNAIGTTWGGDGANKFFIPDLRGRFLRGVDSGAGRDPEATARTVAAPGKPNQGNQGDAVGSMQEDALQQHQHDRALVREGVAGSNGSKDVSEGDEKYNCDPGLDKIEMDVGNVRGARVAPETRPENANVFWIIHAQ